MAGTGLDIQFKGALEANLNLIEEGKLGDAVDGLKEIENCLKLIRIKDVQKLIKMAEEASKNPNSTIDDRVRKLVPEDKPDKPSIRSRILRVFVEPAPKLKEVD